MNVLRALFATLLSFALAGCGSSDSTTAEETFSFGEPEVKTTVTGDFKGTLTLFGKAPTPLSLHLDKAPASTTKAACGNRSLSHPLCISVSTMALVGTLSTDDKTFDNATVAGAFDVYGTELKSGTLQLTAGSRTLSFTFDGGVFKNGTVQESATAIGEATLVR